MESGHIRKSSQRFVSSLFQIQTREKNMRFECMCVVKVAEQGMWYPIERDFDLSTRERVFTFNNRVVWLIRFMIMKILIILIIGTKICSIKCETTDVAWDQTSFELWTREDVQRRSAGTRNGISGTRKESINCGNVSSQPINSIDFKVDNELITLISLSSNETPDRQRATYCSKGILLWTVIKKG